MSSFEAALAVLYCVVHDLLAEVVGLEKADDLMPGC